jgi:DNA-binding CsgD family transcriptional regulator
MEKGRTRLPSYEGGNKAALFYESPNVFSDIRNSQTKAEAIIIFENTMREYPIDCWSYRIRRKPSYIPAESIPEIEFSNLNEFYGDGFIETYRQRRLDRYNPSIKSAYFNSIPIHIRLKDITPNNKNEEIHNQYMEMHGWVDAIYNGLGGPGALVADIVVCNRPNEPLPFIPPTFIEFFGTLSRTLHRRLTYDLIPSCIAPSITLREIDVMHIMAEGWSSTKVAEKLGISVNTVNNHIASAKEKLGARNKTHALFLALELGLI